MADHEVAVAVFLKDVDLAHHHEHLCGVPSRPKDENDVLLLQVDQLADFVGVGLRSQVPADGSQDLYYVENDYGLT